MESTTIFDDVFRTMLEKMSALVIPLINEVFHTQYSEDEPILQLKNEHYDKNGRVVTDSSLKIQKKLYHIECQSTDDQTMAIRMIEYDFRIASENVQKHGRRYRMEFPKSCVLYLRSGSTIPDYLETDVVLPDESTFVYRVPAVKMDSFSKEDIFSKQLLMLLPYYALRYEKQFKRKDTAAPEALLADYQDIRRRLERELTEKGKAGLYTDLVDLVIQTSDHIFRENDEVRKGIGDIMGGKVLELASERAYAAGQKQGMAQGEAQGIAQGEENLGLLISTLLGAGKIREASLVAEDPAERKKYYKLYGIDTSPEPERVQKAQEQSEPAASEALNQ